MASKEIEKLKNNDSNYLLLLAASNFIDWSKFIAGSNFTAGI